MTVESRMRERLAALAPVQLDLVDESSRHQGHAGWKEGGNTHWKLAIVSAAFAGRNTVARHRMIYQALGDLMENPIHALSISARSPDENGA
ncbi:MAG: BolA family transcriptional regulator [Betaproteobacteria bacterium]|nr:BolA family transcriptional regulator [Betaproteobacteria bacterium]